MIGKAPTINDIELDLEELVEPISLYCEESLSPDTEGEEEDVEVIYRVDSYCECGAAVRLVITASDSALRTLQQLLTEDLTIVCPTCARNLVQNGR